MTKDYDNLSEIAERLGLPELQKGAGTGELSVLSPVEGAGSVGIDAPTARPTIQEVLAQPRVFTDLTDEQKKALSDPRNQGVRIVVYHTGVTK
jgi:hypothetical protein